MALRPVEWLVGHPSSPSPVAIIRLLRLGPDRELYYRAVTYADAPARKLIGYWASLEDAEQGATAAFEATMPKAWRMTGGGSERPPMLPPPQKPPPSRPAR
jgi:hypothetical protein